MANLKEIRNRIASVKSTMQITSAMKMVSAAKLRKAQDAILQLRPFADKLKEIMARISESFTGNSENPYLAVREVNKLLMVVITSNKGLCGAFNTNVTKRAASLLNTDLKDLNENNSVDILSIGKKGSEFFRSKGYNLVDSKDELFDDLSYENVATMAKSIMRQFALGSYDKVLLIYNQFKNAAVHHIITENFLPISFDDQEEEEDEPHTHIDYTEYIYEPSEKTILEGLIPKTLKIQLYKALLDSNASEHGARMTAMHKATDNATEIVKNLTLDYNKARQAAITNEILEIVSGAEALKG